MLLLGELVSKFIAHQLILAYCWCAYFYCTENVEHMIIQYKAQTTLKVSVGQIKLINGKAGIITMSHYVKLFCILGLNQKPLNPLTPKTEGRSACSIRNVSVEHQYAIFMLTVQEKKPYLEKSYFACRAGNQILWDCLLR